MANLAIKGHKTRGSEVIALLEMLGGNNPHKYTADCESLYFYIDGGTNNIYYDWANNPKESSKCLFTLEEFLEKFPYKVGDKVTHNLGILMNVVRMYWDAECNVIRYDIQSPVDNNYKLKAMLTKHLQPYKEESMDRKYNIEEYLKAWEETEKGLEVVVNDNFELKEENGKFYIIKKQPKYPKTYEECCKVLGYSGNYNLILTTDVDNKLFNALYRLKVCRDAYWNIAGEQMGLGKSWEPDWLNFEQDKYVLYTHNNAICSNRYVLGHNILAFPTEEIRDAFYENFKELIENVKELL